MTHPQQKHTASGTFARVPMWLIEWGASPRAVQLYVALSGYADAHTGKAWPARETLAKRMRCHANTVDRAVAELVKLGAVTVQSRHRTTHLYVLHSHPVVTELTTGGDRGVTTDGDSELTTDGDSHSPQGVKELEPKNQNQKNQAAAAAAASGSAVDSSPVDQKPWRLVRDETSDRTPRSVSRQLTRIVGELLADGATEHEIRAGLREWSARDRVGPRILPLLVADAQKGANNTDAAFARGLERMIAEGRELDAEERAWLDAFRGRA